MRWLGRSVCALRAVVALSLLSRCAGATPPITEPWERPPQAAAQDTSVEQAARAASSAAYSATNTGALLGLGLMAGGVGAGSGSIILTGYGVWAVGILAGPAMGWERAGYPGRSAVSTLVRLGILVSSIAIPLASKKKRESEFGGLAVAASGLTGLVVATFEAYYECDAVADYVRQHGPGRRTVSIVPATGPAGAPGLAVVIRFD